MAVVFIAYVLTECDHFLSPVCDWVLERRECLSQALGQPIRDTDFTDDRLEDLLDAVGLVEVGEQIEMQLGQHLLRAYALPTDTGRIDTTSVAIYHLPGRDWFYLLGPQTCQAKNLVFGLAEFPAGTTLTSPARSKPEPFTGVFPDATSISTSPSKKGIAPMQEEKLQKLLHLCKVLLDEDRLRILGVLANRSANIKELAVQLNLKEVIASRHLARLVEAGLVRADPDDESVYRLDLKVVQSMKKDLFTREQTNEPTGDHESPADRVLNSFLDGERLIRMPSNHTKRMVILEWLASEFEVGSTYPERAVNEILRRHHPDYATLRRALVDYGLMQREKGIYWRVVEGKP